MKILIGLAFATAMLGQMPVTVRAGDPAPEIDWNKVVRAPESARYRPGLTGQYTVLSFLPNITANAKPIAQRNELIAKFADKPVQFVWIASESRSEVEPFLKEHPIDGWVLIDESGDIARAYGCDFGEVIIDPEGKIVGFTMSADPLTLSAVLDGRVVAMPRDTDDDQVSKLLAGDKVRIDTEPENFAPSAAQEKPDFAPSYEVHISPSHTKGTVGGAASDFWAQRGFSLKAIVAVVYGRQESRIELPAPLDNDDKFDFVMVLPKEEPQDTIYQLVQRAVEKRFAVSPVVESRPMDVYVMTAIKGKTPPANTGPDSLGGGVASSSSFEFALPAGTPQTPEAIEKAIAELMKHPENIGLANVNADNTTMDELCRTLEMRLGRPIINETGLDGSYDIEVKSEAKSTDEFIRMLREQTGLVLTPATRSVEILVMQPLN